jgi:hypothetical protein
MSPVISRTAIEPRARSFAPAFKLGFKILLVLALMGGLFLPYHSTLASTIPTFDVTNVVVDDNVTILTYHYPAGVTFTVRMGEYGTLGVGGIVVGTFDSGAGGSFNATFDIPAALKGDKRIAIRADGAGGFFSYNWFYNNTSSSSSSASSSSSSTTTSFTGIPTFSILDVVKNDKVTIRCHNYPGGKIFTVRMGVFGTAAIGGTVVGKFDSGSGGDFDVTFDIPGELVGRSRIAIRADSPDGFFSYNWFWNNTASGSSSSSSGSSSGTAFTGIPTIKILDVDKDNKVTIRTNNFPADHTFTVLMGKYGTLGVGGIEVAKTDSDKGGAFDVTYNIPDELKGDRRIAIRLESSDGFFAFNWFWNNTAATSSSSSSSSSSATTFSGIPTFSISSVVKDDSVTITTNNFPAGETFTVRMGDFGTAGIGGIVVDTTSSGSGGSFTATYAIPAALKGGSRIAIRMDSPGGFFSYNWFWNNTSP